MVLGAASQYIDDFLEYNSLNCNVILEVTVAPSNTLPKYNVTCDNRRKDAQRCEQLYIIVQIALWKLLQWIIRLFIKPIIAG